MTVNLINLFYGDLCIDGLGTGRSNHGYIKTGLVFCIFAWSIYVFLQVELTYTNFYHLHLLFTFPTHYFLVRGLLRRNCRRMLRYSILVSLSIALRCIVRWCTLQCWMFIVLMRWTIVRNGTELGTWTTLAAWNGYFYRLTYYFPSKNFFENQNQFSAPNIIIMQLLWSWLPLKSPAIEQFEANPYREFCGLRANTGFKGSIFPALSDDESIVFL